ncbi:MAG: hypothetical protein WC979_09185 [Candidatus Pacearchaeota archaeon]|jgi:hypothetical protein
MNLIFKRNKKAQETMGMSFGMIFAIILMIFFIVVAFIAIKAFLETSNCAKVKIFVDKVQTEVDKTWNSQQDDSVITGSLPSSVDYICFGNLSRSIYGASEVIGQDIEIYEVYGANMFIYPIGSSCEMPHHKIKHLDLEGTTKSENPLCIPVEKGIIKIKIEKAFEKRLVKVSKV